MPWKEPRTMNPRRESVGQITPSFPSSRLGTHLIAKFHFAPRDSRPTPTRPSHSPPMARSSTRSPFHARYYHKAYPTYRSRLLPREGFVRAGLPGTRKVRCLRGICYQWVTTRSENPGRENPVQTLGDKPGSRTEQGNPRRQLLLLPD